jgi:hypothetical protein
MKTEPTNRETLREIEALLPDFVAESPGHKPFDHFFCPILHVDEPTTFCMGHITPEALGGKVMVPQRKDVDGFFGAMVEADMIAAIRNRGKPLDEILGRGAVRREMRPRFETPDGTTVGFYIPKDGQALPAGHTPSSIHFDDGTEIAVTMKGSREQLTRDGELNGLVEVDCLYEATAAALKAAHLTCFRLYGYRYVFSYVGRWVALPLREFFFQHRHTKKKDIHEALFQRFAPYLPMLRPMCSPSGGTLPFDGSVSDGNIRHLLTGEGKVFSYGVVLRMHNDLYTVFLPGEAEMQEIYDGFLASPPPSVCVGIGPWGRPRTKTRIAFGSSR